MYSSVPGGMSVNVGLIHGCNTVNAETHLQAARHLSRLNKGI